MTFHVDSVPPWVFVPVAALLLAWHSSLQHEFIHGHPTPWPKVNRMLGSVPLSLWLPFESYRISHLLHHHDDRLTDPLDDPESYYWTPEQWRALGAPGRLIVRAHSTLAGRLLLGPSWNISRYLWSEARAIWSGDRLRRRIWRAHALASVGVAVWLFCICRLNPCRCMDSLSTRARRYCCYDPLPNIVPTTGFSNARPSWRIRGFSGHSFFSIICMQRIMNDLACHGTRCRAGIGGTGAGW